MGHVGPRFRIKSQDQGTYLTAPPTAQPGALPTFELHPSTGALWQLDALSRNLVHVATRLCLTRNGTIDQWGNAFLALSRRCDMPVGPAGCTRCGRTDPGLLREWGSPRWCMHAYGGRATPGTWPVLFNQCEVQDRMKYTFA